jgi:hypothetical protein
MNPRSGLVVPSLAAEEAVRTIMATAAQHLRQEALLAAAPSRRGRLRTLPVGSVSRQTRCQSTLLRLTSIVESYVVGQLVVRSEIHAPEPRSPILDDIYVSAEDRAIGSWPQITVSYKQWLGIKLNGSPDWTHIQALNNARNAVAHGLGNLTRRQARKNSNQLKQSLQQVGVSVDGTRIVISESAIMNGAKTSRAFIYWVDERLVEYDNLMT